jgi:hypothetical protein
VHMLRRCLWMLAVQMRSSRYLIDEDTALAL